MVEDVRAVERQERPGAQAVRGYSFFGDSYVYVIFADGTDIYWARSRVLEYLNAAAARWCDARARSPMARSSA